jgi:hypothetical protein
LRGHTRKDWNYAMRVTAGMRDLRSLYVRANTCVACHQNLDSDITKAGHPELTFELDGQSVAEPKHWRDDDPFSGVRAWLVGQAVALREISWALSKNERPTRTKFTDGRGWPGCWRKRLHSKRTCQSLVNRAAQRAAAYLLEHKDGRFISAPSRGITIER